MWRIREIDGIFGHVALVLYLVWSWFGLVWFGIEWHGIHCMLSTLTQTNSFLSHLYCMFSLLYAPYLKMIRYIFSTHAFRCGSTIVLLNVMRKRHYAVAAQQLSSHTRTHHIWDRFQFQMLTLDVSISISYVYHIDWLSYHFDLCDANRMCVCKIWKRMYKSMINHTNTHRHTTNWITVVPYIRHATVIEVKPFTTWHELPWSHPNESVLISSVQKARTFHSTWFSFQFPEFTAS